MFQPRSRHIHIQSGDNRPNNKNPRRREDADISSHSHSAAKTRGGGRFAGAGNGLDGRVKSDIWRRLIDFQSDTSAVRLTFEPTLSSEERKYVHKIAENLQMDTKSQGNKKDGTRFVCVYKDRKRGQRRKVEGKEIQLLPLPYQCRALIDQFLSQFPVTSIDAFDPTNVRLKQHAEKNNNVGVQSYRGWRPTINNIQHRQSYLSNPQYRSMLASRQRLPIFKERDTIIQHFMNSQVIVISGSTGCGKSTQVPQYIMEHIDALVSRSQSQSPLSLDGEIICTQPRRISAISLAERVSAERGEVLGETVGYQIRLEKVRSQRTRVLFCTVGILLRRLSNDRLLTGVSTLIIDEAHEREKNCDFLLIIIRDLLKIRRDLKLVLMSATLNSQLFSDYFWNCPHLFCPGFTYPVQTFYLPDVLELTGYQSLSLSSLSKSNPKERMEMMRRKKANENSLQGRLELLIAQQLFADDTDAINTTADAHTLTVDESHNHSIIEADTVTDNLSEDEARKFLLERHAKKQQAIGWKDTYTFVPNYTLDGGSANGGGDDSASALENSLSALISGLNVSDSKPSPAPVTTTTTTATTRPVATITNTGGEDRHQIVSMEHSVATLATVSRLESEGMDYIDYTLIVETLHYICTKFAADHQPTHTSSHSHRRHSNGKGYEVDVSNGSILVFLPGWEDINRVMTELASHPHFARQPHAYQILPLHGSIASSEQKRIFSRPVANVRKIILSTNIAETSVTIDDVVFVIDTGKMKEKTYDAYSKMSSLQSTWISQANAQQRSGRAGRSRPGICFRLYSQLMFERMEQFPTPELLRSPLEEICLSIKLLDIQESCQSFLLRGLQPPSIIAVTSSIALLKNLGALTDSEELTELGEYLATMPLEPRLGKMILYGAAFQCLDPILTIAACLSYRDPFLLPVNEERAQAMAMKQWLAQGSNCDLITLLNACQGFHQSMRQGGAGGGWSYCRKFYLQYSTMSMINDMKGQLLTILDEADILDTSTIASTNSDSGTGGSVNDRQSMTRHYNLYSNDLNIIHAVCVAGLYPNTGKVNYHGPKKMPLLSTRDQLTRVKIHPSSVNSSMKKLMPSVVSVSNGRGKRDGRVSLAPWVMYQEVVRSSEIYVRSTSIVTPLTLALLVGDRHKQPPPEALVAEDDEKEEKSERKVKLSTRKKEAKRVRKLSGELSERERLVRIMDKFEANDVDDEDDDFDEYEDGDDNEEEEVSANSDGLTDDQQDLVNQLLDEMEGKDADISDSGNHHNDDDDDGPDELVVDVTADDVFDDNGELSDDDLRARDDALQTLIRIGSLSSPNQNPQSPKSPPLGQSREPSTLEIDDFIQYAMDGEDLERVQSIHRYVNWLIHKRITKADIHSNEQQAQSKVSESESAMESAILRLFASLMRTENELMNLSFQQSSKQRIHEQSTAMIDDETLSAEKRSIINLLPAASATTEYRFELSESIFHQQRARGRRGGSRGRGGRGGAQSTFVPRSPTYPPQPMLDVPPRGHGRGAPRGGRGGGHSRGGSAGDLSHPQPQSLYQPPPLSALGARDDEMHMHALSRGRGGFRGRGRGRDGPMPQRPH